MLERINHKKSQFEMEKIEHGLYLTILENLG